MSVEKVAVLGGGLMGSGIAESVARAGLEVTIRDVDEAAVAGAGTRIAASLYRAVSGGKLTRRGRRGDAAADQPHRTTSTRSPTPTW